MTPIIFLHGWSGKANSWDSNLQYFKNLGYPVYALKMPGFDLQNPSPNWGVLEYAKFAIDDISKSFPNQKVILIGHSFGGRVSILIASKHSELIEALVLTSSAGLNLEPSFLRRGLLFASQSARWLENKVFFSFLIVKMRNITRSIIGAKGYKNADDTMKQVFKNVVNLDLRDYLPSIRCPTLIVWGEDDKTTPLKMAKAFHSGITESKLVIINNAGHHVHKTNPEEWNHIVEDFINQL